MKVVKGIFAGLGIGLVAGIVITLIVQMLPLLGCTGELACGFVNCDPNCLSKADRTMSSCSTISHTFNYAACFIFSTIIATGIGTIWGISVTAKEVSEANAIKRAADEKARMEREQRNKAEMHVIFSKSLNEVSGLSNSLNDELKFDTYQGAYIVKDDIDELLLTKNKTISYMDKLLKENGEAGGQK